MSPLVSCFSNKIRATSFPASTRRQAHAKYHTYLLLNLGNGPAVIGLLVALPTRRAAGYADKRGQVTQLTNQI